MRNICSEIVGRASLSEKTNLADIYGILADIEEDGRVALAHIDKARDAGLRLGQSSATWDLREIQLLAQRADPRFSLVLEHVIKEHLKEPGVREALQQILYSVGLVDDYGRRRGQAGSEESAEPAIVGTESTADAGKLWTPDSERPKEKSGLWLPGQQ